MPGGRRNDDKYPIKTTPNKVKWFGVCQCTSRGEEWTSKKIVELDTEDLKVAATVTANACYFKGPKGLQLALNEYDRAKIKDDATELFFWDAITSTAFGNECVFINEKKTGMAVVDEEWRGGFGRTKEEAQEMYFKSVKIMNRNMGDQDGDDDF